MSPNPDPLEKDLRQAMHERWDATPMPSRLGEGVRTRLQQPTPFRRALNLAGAFAGVALLAALVFAFSALLDRRPIQTAVTQIVVTREVTVPATQISPSLVEQAPPQFSEPHPILGDGRVRQAIAYCTDRAALLRAAYPWLTDTAPFEADSFVPRNHWAYPTESTQFQRYPFDGERGQALLAEAGWNLPEGQSFRVNANGEELALTLTTTNAAFRQIWASVWEQQLANCGIRLVRLHAPGAWFFGESTGLRRRDFEIAAFAWVTEDDPGGRELWACDAVPTLANGWQGQNYSGWCNITADAAIRQATQSFNPAERRAAYQTFQEELSQDVPVLPLFFRAAVSAINPALENFAPDVNGAEPFTWNAAQWRIPNKETLIIGESSEPASLFANETAYVSQVVGALIFGRDAVYRNYEFQPITLPQLPTLENGGAIESIVLVKDGSAVLDSIGQPITLTAGAVVRDANGNDVVVYNGGEIALRQLTVTYTFFDTLTWSDGVPVSRADYELAYKIICDPQTGAARFIGPNPVCDQIANVEFLSDSTYRVTWKPGFREAIYNVPPLGRQPAHQLINGRRLDEVPPSEWQDLPEIHHRPMGIGPYRLISWVFGEGFTLEANPHYFAGPPATPRIEIRVREAASLPALLAAGEVDVLGWDSILSSEPEFQTLLDAQAQGLVRVITTPSDTWEHVDFALFLK